MQISLVSVYRVDSASVLYQMLRERLEERRLNISHANLPSRSRHIHFMRTRPYRAWYLIKANSSVVGQIWLNRQNEIGLTILKKERHKGYEKAAIMALISRHRPLPPIPSKRSGSFLANVNPNNRAVVGALRNLGAKILQHTYKLP